MRPVSLDIQKKIVYWPGINIFIIPIWLYNCCVLGCLHRFMFKTLFIFFSSAIPLIALQIIAYYSFPQIYEIISLIVGLSVPIIIGTRLIRLQETIEAQ